MEDKIIRTLLVLKKCDKLLNPNRLKFGLNLNNKNNNTEKRAHSYNTYTLPIVTMLQNIYICS